MQNKTTFALAGGCVLAGIAAAVIFVNISAVAPDNAAAAIVNKQEVLASTQKTAATVLANSPRLAGTTQQPQANTTTAISAEEILQLPDANPDYATLGDRANEIAARRNGRAIDPRALQQAIAQNAAWAPLDSAPAGFPLTSEEQIDGREFIQVNPLKIESLMPGDTFEMDIAQINRSFTAVIDQVQVGDNNNVTWVGHLQNHKEESQVVLTRGDSLIVGGFTTPEGHFEMEARGEQGWIANSKTLFKTPDVLLEVAAEELAKTPATLPPTPQKENIL